jgi:prepilin-type N-terminal cleavage/methylation domain-containing protein
MRKGFTLIEVLTALAIIIVVAAISFPVIVNAKDSAYRAKSISNMRQVHLAIEMYAQEHNGATEGSMQTMGLPPWPSEEFLGSSVREMYPPMRPSPKWSTFMYMPIPAEHDHRDITWEQYTQKVGPAAVLICDPFFNPKRTDDYEEYWMDPYVQKFVMGVTVSGSLVKRKRAGYLTLSWWMD